MYIKSWLAENYSFRKLSALFFYHLHRPTEPWFLPKKWFRVWLKFCKVLAYFLRFRRTMKLNKLDSAREETCTTWFCRVGGPAVHICSTEYEVLREKVQLWNWYRFLLGVEQSRDLVSQISSYAEWSAHKYHCSQAMWVRSPLPNTETTTLLGFIAYMRHDWQESGRHLKNMFHGFRYPWVTIILVTYIAHANIHK
jgi:hypothetical protein